MTWRYLAQRLNGDGHGEFLDMDLPLREASITRTLSGPDSIDGTIQPEVARLRADDGLLLLEEWSTAIYAEKDGVIRAGGILTSSEFSGSSWRISAMGFAGYPQGMPYTDAKFYVYADPADIVRDIWDHLQGQPGGDIGMLVDSTTTPVRLGKELKQVQFDTQAGENVSFEAGPYKLAWYQTADLGRELDQLAEQTPFDYAEEHAWVDGGVIEHRLRLGYPRLGRRRDDLRFAVGENVAQLPTLERDGSEFANEVLALGAGEGRAMVRATDVRRDGKLRRVAVVADKTLREVRSVRALATRELGQRSGQDGVTDITVLDHPHAPIGSWQVGDEIRLQGRLGWVDVDDWFRVLSYTLTPDSPEVAQLTIARPQLDPISLSQVPVQA